MPNELPTSPLIKHAETVATLIRNVITEQGGNPDIVLPAWQASIAQIVTETITKLNMAVVVPPPSTEALESLAGGYHQLTQEITVITKPALASSSTPSSWTAYNIANLLVMSLDGKSLPNDLDHLPTGVRHELLVKRISNTRDGANQIATLQLTTNTTLY